jgi:hypothetical protein
MARSTRGGYRRRYINPAAVGTYVAGGRWGPRRVRTDECRAILTAETAYTRLLTDPGTVRVGGRGTVTYELGTRVVTVPFEVRANTVWRYGRVFLRCPRCSGRVTRVYLPRSDAGAACRKCWGLTYRSRMADYKARGPLAFLGSWGEAATVLARERRRERSRERWAERTVLRRINKARAGLPRSSGGY